MNYFYFPIIIVNFYLKMMTQCQIFIICLFFILLLQGHSQEETQQIEQETNTLKTVASEEHFIDTTEEVIDNQERTENNNEQTEGLEAIKKTLEYGVDSVITEAISTLKQLNTTQFTDEILHRITKSRNDEVRMAGLNYFRYFKSDKAIPFVFTIIANYAEESNHIIQRAIFYIKDFYKTLDTSQKEEILSYIDEIIETDNVGNISAALELVPLLYSEEEVPYNPKVVLEVNEVKVTEEQFDNTIILTEDTNITKTSSPQLYSQTLKKYYDNTTSQANKEVILQVLGKIQAYNMIDTLIEIAENDGETSSLRVAALKSLGEFKQYPNKEIEEKIINLFDILRSSEQVAIRQAVFSSFANMKESHLYANVDFETWILNGIQDNESKVRIETLKAVNNILDADPNIIKNLDFFPFIIEHDPNPDVQAEALVLYVDLEKRNEGKEYLLTQIKGIRNINAKNKNILNLSFKKMDELNTIEPIIQLSAKFINKKFSYLLQIISEIASQYTNDLLIDLAKIFIKSDDSQVVYNTLNIIARNRMYSFLSYVKVLSRDRTKSSKVRVRASQVLDLLNNPALIN